MSVLSLTVFISMLTDAHGLSYDVLEKEHKHTRMQLVALHIC